jgi:hypothetical protein
VSASHDPYIRGSEVGRAEYDSICAERDRARGDLTYFLGNFAQWWATYRPGEVLPPWADIESARREPPAGLPSHEGCVTCHPPEGT